MPPAFQRREHYEQVGRAIALILIVMPRGVAGLGRDRHARFGDQLLRCLVQAHHGERRVVRPLINLQYVLHAGDEGGVGIRRDDPLLLQMRLESVFFSVRPIVLSLARATMFSCTTAVSSSCSVHRARPLGGSEQANAISLASAAPSKMRGLAEAGECLRVSTASNPSSTSCWRVRATVATLVSRAEAIWLSLHPAPADEVSAFNRMRALTNCPARCLPARISVLSCSRSSSLSVTMYFLTAICFAVTTHLRGFRSHRFREPTQNQRRRALDRGSPGRTHGSAVANPRIRVCKPSSQRLCPLRCATACRSYNFATICGELVVMLKFLDNEHQRLLRFIPAAEHVLHDQHATRLDEIDRHPDEIHLRLEPMRGILGLTEY